MLIVLNIQGDYMNSYYPMIQAFDKMIIHFQSKTMAKFNLYSKGETCALHFLLERGDFVLPSEMSGVLQCSAARITQLITQLEHKGQVKREIDYNDRRKIKLMLTEEGKERAIKERDEMYKDLEKIFVELGEEDSTEFMRILARFFDIAHQLD